MTYGLWIRGGVVVDPSRNMEGAGEVLVRGDRIAEPPGNGQTDAEQVFDAGGYLVLPGLIDFHAHLFVGGSEIGIHPDSGLLPQGVTTAVDAGTAGIANYDLFSSSVVAQSAVRIKALLNVSPAGLATTRYHEDVDPRHYDLARTAALFARYRGELIGLKVRQSRDIVGNLGLEPLRATVTMAEQLGCPVVVHTTDPPSAPGELAGLLRPGDVFCHVFNGTGRTILGPDGAVLPEIREARARGVLFDAANGRMHFAFKTAREALRQSFLPDVISSDLTGMSLYRSPVFGLPYLLSKYLNMGMPILPAVAACTSTPARLLGMAKEIGTLAAGACADIAVFKQVERPVEFRDTQGQTMMGRHILVPMLTVRAGRVVYRRPDF